MDPVLKLYIGCQVMLTANTCVRMGLANGTQATVKKVVLKATCIPTPVHLDGIPVPAVLAQ